MSNFKGFPSVGDHTKHGSVKHIMDLYDASYKDMWWEADQEQSLTDYLLTNPRDNDPITEDDYDDAPIEPRSYEDLPGWAKVEPREIVHREPLGLSTGDDFPTLFDVEGAQARANAWAQRNLREWPQGKRLTHSLERVKNDYVACFYWTDLD